MTMNDYIPWKKNCQAICTANVWVPRIIQMKSRDMTLLYTWVFRQVDPVCTNSIFHEKVNSRFSKIWSFNSKMLLRPCKTKPCFKFLLLVRKTESLFPTTLFYKVWQTQFNTNIRNSHLRMWKINYYPPHSKSKCVD